MLFLVKIFASALVIALVSELSKRSSFMAALLVSLPIISVLSLIWIYLEERNIPKIIDLSYSIFWLVIPSLGFFLLLPFLLKQQLGFFASLAISCLALASVYGAGQYIYSHYTQRTEK